MINRLEAHEIGWVRRLIKAEGASVLFLLLYPRAFTLIVGAFFKVDQSLRTAKTSPPPGTGRGGGVDTASAEPSFSRS